MILSYVDLLGDGQRHRINATITTDHPQSSYGQPVIVLEDGNLLDISSFVMLGYQVVQATASEIDLLKSVYRMIALSVDVKRAASEFGRRGGNVTSEAKTLANRAKANNPPKAGQRPRGRPRKQASEQ